MDIRPLVKHRVFAPYSRMHNTQIENDLYNQRSMTQTVNSSVKHSYGSVVRAREWYREFREIVLICTVYNIKQCITPRFQRLMTTQKSQLIQFASLSHIDVDLD